VFAGIDRLDVPNIHEFMVSVYTPSVPSPCMNLASWSHQPPFTTHGPAPICAVFLDPSGDYRSLRFDHRRYRLL